MTDFVPIDGRPGLVRDMSSKAISNTNTEALRRYEESKKRFDTMKDQNSRLENLENEMSEIKALLLQLVKGS